MKRIAVSSVLALAALAAAPAPGVPVAGPGGVYYAVADLCKAFDANDAEYLGKAFVRSRHGLEFFIGEDGELETREPDGAFELVDELADGTTACATSLDELKRVSDGFRDPKLGAPVTTITRVYADCPSAECSYAAVEFERAWGEGDTRRVVPMRATALVRYDGDSAPHFRVFHWHATRR